MMQAMRMMGKQFVLGQTIEEAIKNCRPYEKKGYKLSFDMLGEGARTIEDSQRLFESYRYAITKVAEDGKNKDYSPCVSIKLSALHPRYEYGQSDKAIPEITASLLELSELAAGKGVALTIDAEEVDRLEMSLRIIENIASDKKLKDWDGLGLAVQAYQKRALPLIDYLGDMAAERGQRLQVRLVKGAYWDTEIKRAQILGLNDYPVFTRKSNTDLSYLACASKLLEKRDIFYPMFATHNAHSVASIMEMAANDNGGFEFQRLYGMGETLHDLIIKDGIARVSIYAPCGSHEDLLPYLVRRLLENGANSSFINQLLDKNVPVEEVVADPVADVRAHNGGRHPKITMPADIYGEGRANSKGVDLTEDTVWKPLLDDIEKSISGKRFEAAPLIGGELYKDGASREITNPADHGQAIGAVWEADEGIIEEAFKVAKKGYKSWNTTDADDRAAALERLADLMEENGPELMGLCIKEAGKTVDDAQAELREAVDFCRYYAHRGRIDFSSEGEILPGPTGESNVMTMHGRGIFVCISPWNFPLAIFTGQVTAALMAGNAVITKPATPTPLVAMRVVEIMIEAGVHADAITLLPCNGRMGAAIVAHPDTAGVAFTGSTEVAWNINRSLAAKDGPIVPLIAETGGQNAMIVDSSALPEQVIDDVLISAFGSAGQRCSALRVLFVQDDVADKVIKMLKGAMAERRIGDPILASSDIGPTIDENSRKTLIEHKKWLDDNAKFIASVPMDDVLAENGWFFAPVAYEIEHISQLEREIFGPCLHVIRFKGEDIESVIKDINSTGFGLTVGLHSRIDSAMRHITGGVRAGNAYVNRTMIGAVVGVQPFGGQGLSGTGPKAGGPHYLHRFATERVVSIDTTASGGNATLVSLEE
jgi:RHH-type proline utilization regulon transcriptional repressor/proline dehydrogenase/delta 1-pyrroline-5-carboxylate dehydrogenase